MEFHLLLVIALVTLSYGDELAYMDRITLLDSGIFRSLFRSLRNFWFDRIEKTGRRTTGAFLQEKFPEDMPFPCDTKVGIGRSRNVPETVHRLRPGDIQVVGAIGDSLTSAVGANSQYMFDMFMENRGLSWCIGGQWDWRNSTTLPNILKVYNPKLVGYSLGDSFAIHKESQFNLAEIGAVTFDLPFMAKALVLRIRSDPRVDFKRDWKMVTITVGGNDICSFVCAMDNPESLPRRHKRNLFKAVKYLRDHLPRTFVNIVSKPTVETVVMAKDKPDICKFMHYNECSCWVRLNASLAPIKRWRRIEDEYTRVEEEVARSKVFRGLKTFAVVYQPWSRNFSLNITGRGNDYTLVAFDCFHMSQKGNAYAGTTLYNNLLQPAGEKSTNWAPPMKKFLCPTRKRPFIFTYDNAG